MTIEEILTSFPQRSQKLAQEMMNAGLNCVGCGASVWETLEAGMLGHGFAQNDALGIVVAIRQGRLVLRAFKTHCINKIKYRHVKILLWFK